MARPKGSAASLERRRRRAVELVEAGLTFNAAARRLGCAASSVMRWFDAWRQGGAGALKVRPSPGRPPKLTPAQRRRLVKSLLKGPLASGLGAGPWTTARIARLIKRESGVRYHRDHIGRLLHRLGWRHRNGWTPIVSSPEKR